MINESELGTLDWVVQDLHMTAELLDPSGPSTVDPVEISRGNRLGAAALRDYADDLAGRVAKARHEQRAET